MVPLLLPIIFLIFATVTADNPTPLIGILTKPLQEEYPNIDTDYTEVVEAKYVHFIEGGGGRVVPLSYKWDTQTLEKVMGKLNGVLFTGGATELTLFDRNDVPIELTEYSKGGKRILDIAIEFNKKGTYYPIWGTCLGYELMLILESNNIKLLGHCRNCSNYNTYLVYNEAEVAKTKLYKNGFTAYQLDIMAKENITYNNHMWMVDNDTFYANQPLVDKYYVLSYSPWWNETTLYISAVEHKEYPFYAVQYHPEKWNYEVSPNQSVIKSREAITLGHGFSNFFIDECRKNNNKFSTYKEELNHLVQNAFSYYHPVSGHLYFLYKKESIMNYFKGEELCFLN